jgi:acyl carrier protein
MIDEAFVRAQIAEQVSASASELPADARLLDHAIDSLDMFNVVMACEQETGTSVDDDDFEKLDTIARIVAHFSK